jgi:Family of unknown function (DUF5330)
MFFLLRTAFWASVGLVLLATFAPGQPSTAPAEIVASDAVNAASATFSDLSGLCGRRPDACAAGSNFAMAFAQRAEAGAKILYDLVGAQLVRQEHAAGENREERQGRSTGAAGTEPAPADAAKASQHTLTATDTAAPWRGPPTRRDAGAKHAT